MLNIAVCVDVSGSISDETLDIVYQKIDALYRNHHSPSPLRRAYLFVLRIIRPGHNFKNEIPGHNFKNEITVIECDTKICNAYKYDGKQRPDRSGGGGTLFKPALSFARTLRPTPDIIIYFTDGYGERLERCTDIPVLWVITLPGDPDDAPHFGEKIRIGDMQKYSLAKLLRK